jgi:hypothetical protein
MGKGKRVRQGHHIENDARAERTREGLVNWAAMVGEVVVRLKHGRQENVSVLLNPTECGVLLEALVVMKKQHDQEET